MKKILIILVIFFTHFVFGQKYILLDSLKTKTKEYTLETKNLYNIDKQIEIYNVFIHEGILLFSVLPPYNEVKKNPQTSIFYNKLSGNYNNVTKEVNISGNWEKIDFEVIKQNIVSISHILSGFTAEWGWDNTPEKKTFEYKLAKRVGDSYYISKTCLTELFLINNSKFPFSTPYGTINTLEPKVTIKKMSDAYTEQFPKNKFPLDIWEKSRSRGNDGAYAIKYYLSGEFTIKNHKAYQFWTLDVWWNMHGDNRHRGIDRFVYIPEKGIVGGSYDFYFRYYKGFHIPDTIIWNNILNEKVMIAEELK